MTGGICALVSGAKGIPKPPTVTGVFLLLKTMDTTTEVLTMYRNIRKLPQLTASTIVLFCELDYLLRRVPDLQITRTVLARRLNMHTDTVTRGLKTLMQQHVIHF